MIETPEIVETTAQLMACLPIVVPREEIRQVMEPGLKEVMSALADQGIEPVGPWCTHHFRIVPGIFDFEICVPVASPVRAVGRVQAGEWPAMRVARTIYAGSYARLGDAWKEFNEWVAASGHKAAEDLWERYVSSAPGAVKTELSRPLL